MPVARLSSKGQITIPAAVRTALGLRQGDEVVLTVHGEEARMRVMKRVPLTDLYGALPARESHPDFEEVRRQARATIGKRRHLGTGQRRGD